MASFGLESLPAWEIHRDIARIRHNSPNGHAQEYILLESAEAAKAAATEGGALRSDESEKHDEQARQEPVKDFALDWYTGEAHGAIKTYPEGEPKY